MNASLHIGAGSAIGVPTDPLDALAALASSTATDITLLHSGVEQGLSLLGFDPLFRIVVDSTGRASVFPSNFISLPSIDRRPVEVLGQAVGSLPFVAPHPLIGWLGFISYDIGRTLEDIGCHTADELRWPLLSFTLFRHYLLFDNAASHPAAYTLGVAPDAAPFPSHHFRTVPRFATPSTQARLIEVQRRDEYLGKIRRVQEYIGAGDIYQANLAQRWVVETPDAPHDIFRRLCAASPAPYGAFMRFTDDVGTRHVLSASPELFVTVDEGRVVTRPIKGTRPRDLADASRDERLKNDLLSSAKDHAELAMIVDLLRNDLGRVSRFGSVRVAQPRTLEQHPTVWHTSSTIESELRADATLADILAAVCPGGSITGAPKIRAMQILEELEGFRRDLYCGNIGVIGPAIAGGGGPSLALNIAIRTMLMQNGRAYLYAGGGIVADSDPMLEYQETHHKAAALFRALGIEPAI
jgi:anthranilate/para-aminobenzoate synthase component I